MSGAMEPATRQGANKGAGNQQKARETAMESAMSRGAHKELGSHSGALRTGSA